MTTTHVHYHYHLVIGCHNTKWKNNLFPQGFFFSFFYFPSVYQHRLNWTLIIHSRNDDWPVRALPRHLDDWIVSRATELSLSKFCNIKIKVLRYKHIVTIYCSKNHQLWLSLEYLHRCLSVCDWLFRPTNKDSLPWTTPTLVVTTSKIYKVSLGRILLNKIFAKQVVPLPLPPIVALPCHAIRLTCIKCSTCCRSTHASPLTNSSGEQRVIISLVWSTSQPVRTTPVVIWLSNG